MAKSLMSILKKIIQIHYTIKNISIIFVMKSSLFNFLYSFVPFGQSHVSIQIPNSTFLLYTYHKITSLFSYHFYKLTETFRSFAIY